MTVAPSSIRWRNEGESGHAHGRPARQRAADPARDEPGEGDRLPDVPVGHPGPDRLDDAGAFVAHDDGHRSRPVAVAHVQVGGAHAGAQDPDPDLAGARGGQRERLDPGRVAALAQHRTADRDRLGGRHQISVSRRRSGTRAGVYGT